MQVAIISDVHNNLVNLEKVLKFCRQHQISQLICCGDLASLATLDFLSKNFTGQIYYSVGNMDEDQLATRAENLNYPNIKIFVEYGEVELGAVKTAFTHFPEVARRLAKSGRYKAVFYGHTHIPWEELVGECLLLNPGTVGGERYQPTFAVWQPQSNRRELIRIYDLT
ncbi:metallophosphoesterase [Candidatus Parcubacteria bacterium]|nr:MAG: metallophosphoesterase [Candidatus Parcubacteria bacterium]